MQNTKWLRLDNSAKIFPFIMTKDNQNLFRISMELNENINPKILQKALNLTIKRFPSFSVKLMKGVFWYYFEHSDNIPVVQEESDIIMQKITPYNCNGFCFRVTYYQNRITIEFYHVLCDGAGALNFMKSLLYSYFTILDYPVTSDSKILTVDTPIDPRELEDSFVANYKPKKLKDLNIAKMTGSKAPAFSVNGTPFKTVGKGVISADLNVNEILAYCKSKGYTLTQFLGGLFMYSVYKTKGQFAKNPNDVVLFVPMNLRKLYQSVTLRNFTLFTRVRHSLKEKDIPIESFIDAVKNGLNNDYTKENLDTNISTAVRGEKLFAFRITPLFIKQFIFSVINKLGGKKPTKTATFSNIGVVDLPESFRPYIKKFAFMLHSYSVIPISFTAITTFDTLTLSFVRCIQDTQIEEFFIKYLADLGFKVTVSSNYWEVEHALWKM